MQSVLEMLKGLVDEHNSQSEMFFKKRDIRLGEMESVKASLYLHCHQMIKDKLHDKQRYVVVESDFIVMVCDSHQDDFKGSETSPEAIASLCEWDTRCGEWVHGQAKQLADKLNGGT